MSSAKEMIRMVADVTTVRTRYATHRTPSRRWRRRRSRYSLAYDIVAGDLVSATHTSEPKHTMREPPGFSRRKCPAGINSAARTILVTAGRTTLYPACTAHMISTPPRRARFFTVEAMRHRRRRGLCEESVRQGPLCRRAIESRTASVSNGVFDPVVFERR